MSRIWLGMLLHLTLACRARSGRRVYSKGAAGSLHLVLSISGAVYHIE